MKKYKIGYTTGVFDLFHVGHLNILKRAKQQCDYLIVGVSTDEVVESYKYKKPIIPYEERKAIVEAFKCVDKVIPQTSLDKIDAWNSLHYDVLFHGSDWEESEMYANIKNELMKIGVQVIFLPYTEDISSSKLINKVKSEFHDDKQ